MRKIRAILLGSLPFAGLLLLWQVLHQLDIIPQWLIPPPWEALREFFRLLIDGTLLELIYKSALNALPGFVAAVIIALVLGVAIGMNRTLDLIMRPALTALYTVPSLIWLPLVVLFFGFTRESVWCLVLLSSFTKMVYNMIAGVRGIRAEWILAARNLGVSRIGMLWHVILPAAFPSIITGLRLGFGSAWRVLVATEMLVMAVGGLGRYIWLAQWDYDYNKVIAGIITIAVIGIAVEQGVFRWLENRTLARWGWLDNSH